MENHEVSLEEEEKGCSGKDLQKKRFQIRNERESGLPYFSFFIFYSKNPERYSASK